LWGLRSAGRRPLRAGMTIQADGEVVGELSSGGFSPTLGVGIGLGYLASSIGPGDSVAIDVRGQQVEVEVVRPPFVDRSPKG
jgi:aminomethyltransferase